ncbi:hypothetical protein [Streptomyces sp. NBC_00063]|uniref:hypothetical protein n=1 Tax=Streptomyces sp. NBC_00063 TaxID=2975638 RepID=UPI003D71E696
MARKNYSAEFNADVVRLYQTTPGANLKFMGDITYLPAGDGEFLYLVAALDCLCHRVVGWSIATDHGAQ